MKSQSYTSSDWIVFRDTFEGWRSTQSDLVFCQGIKPAPDTGKSGPIIFEPGKNSSNHPISKDASLRHVSGRDRQAELLGGPQMCTVGIPSVDGLSQPAAFTGTNCSRSH